MIFQEKLNFPLSLNIKRFNGLTSAFIRRSEDNIYINHHYLFVKNNSVSE